METDGSWKIFEIGVSFRYAQEHEWVMQAITGFLSAYFMEDAGFRLKRHLHEFETGMDVWICEAPGEKFMRRLLKRLQVDLPPFELYRRDSDSDAPKRHVIDLPSLHSEQEESAAS